MGHQPDASRQHDLCDVAWFTYDFDGTPTWLVAALQTFDSIHFNGTIYRTTGPPYFASPFDPSRVVVTELGNMQLWFFTGKNTELQYAMNELAGSVFQRKWIERETIVAPATVCK